MEIKIVNFIQRIQWIVKEDGVCLSSTLLLLQEGADDSWCSIGGNWGSVGRCSIGGNSGSAVDRRGVGGVGGWQGSGRVGGHWSSSRIGVGGCRSIGGGGIAGCSSISGHWRGQIAGLSDGEAESQADEELQREARQSEIERGKEREREFWTYLHIVVDWVVWLLELSATDAVGQFAELFYSPAIGSAA